MKAYRYLLMLLFAAGAIIASLLLIQHFYPESKVTSFACGGGLVNPCLALSQSRWSSLWGIPIAAYGLFFYLAGLFILLIADYAGERYLSHAIAVILPLTAVALLADIALAIILIVGRHFCALCVATYGLNIAVMAIAVLWYRRAAKDDGIRLATLYREMFSTRDASSDAKAFRGAFVLFMFMLAFSVFSTSSILKTKTEGTRPPVDRITGFLKNFYRGPVENITFPPTGLALGDPKAEITIIAFTDFLCSACHELYNLEKVLFSKYPGKIRMIYYNYPLDMGCNPNLTRTVYENSCVAARAMIAASEGGFLEPYVVRHFADYQTIKHGYSAKKASDLMAALNDRTRRGMTEQAFLARMNAPETARRVEEHIKLAKELAVDATPTIFIAGRRIIGAPPIQILEGIIERELAQKQGSE